MSRIKNLLALALLAMTFLPGCSKANQYKIKGELKNVNKGVVSFLQTNNGKIDTIANAQVVNGKFELSGEVKHPKTVLVFINRMQAFNMFLEEGDINITAVVEGSKVTDYTVKGGDLYDKIIEPGRKKYLDFISQITSGLSDPKLNEKDKLLLIEKASKSILKLLDDERLRVANIYKSTDDALVQLMARDYNNRVMYDKVTSMEDIAKLEKELGSNEVIDRLKAKLPAMIEQFNKSEAVGLGKVFKDFELKNEKGNVLKLSDVVKQNKLILLDFWASWLAALKSE